MVCFPERKDISTLLKSSACNGSLQFNDLEDTNYAKLSRPLAFLESAGLTLEVYLKVHGTSYIRT